MKKLIEKPQESSTALFILFTLKEGKKGWGFKQMGLSRKYLARQKDMRFGLMLGTGNGRGFSARPDFSRYAFFTSWKNNTAAENFLQHSTFLQEVHSNSTEVFTTRLMPVTAKGSWKGQQPLSPLAEYPPQYNGPIVALTRARIRWQRLWDFWKHVPAVSASTTTATGLLAQTGIGEIPLIEQATFIWETEKDLKNFAYQMQQHREVIKKTHSQNWYSEELFARFIPLSAEGSWNGTNPLEGWISC